MVSKYDITWMRTAYNIANENSKDKSTKIGAVITTLDDQIVKTGYNGFAIGINDDVKERHERPLKYNFSAHAEGNAIFLSARAGVSTKNCKLYTNTLPCNQCAIAIIQAGISEIIYHKQYYELWIKNMRPQWTEHDKITKEMFEETKKIVREIDYFFNIDCLLDGKLVRV
jgi:dCMP deaminase